MHITITNNSRFLRHMARVAAIMMTVLVPIGLGVALDSAAMQWVGFILGCFAVISFANIFNKNHTVHSFDEARALLDKLENESK
jgi:hypothetical protein